MDGNRSCALVSVKDDESGLLGFRIIWPCYDPAMKLLKKVNDQVTLQILSDLLDSGGFKYRVEGAGMNSLMPLTGVIEARIMVDEEDFGLAQGLLADMESALNFKPEEAGREE